MAADTTELEAELKLKLEAVLEDEAKLHTYNTRDCLIVALILNRKDLLDSEGYSMLEATEQLAPKMLEAARKVERRYRAYLPLKNP